MAFENHGIPVTIVELTQDAIDHGLGRIARTYASSVERGRISQTECDERMSLIEGAVDMGGLAQADLVIEAVVEDLDIKKKVFANLDTVCKSTCILASNTSYLDVNSIASATSRPGRVLGLHFFSPANVMKLVEVIRTSSVEEDVLDTVLETVRRIGKIPVVVGVCHGFVGNRMLAARGSENEHLLAEGATVAQVDEVFRDFGWPMGPFQMQDLAGLDISWRNRRARNLHAPVADALCEQGNFGQKTGRGYYCYDGGSRIPLYNPDIEPLILKQAGARGVTQRPISTQEIVERTLFPLVNEGFNILEEGIAASETDIDVIWRHGYGFPANKGGPMHWARTVGLHEIGKRLDHWHLETGRPVFKRAETMK